MTKKPTYEELEQRIKELEKEAVEHKREKEELQIILDAVPVMIFQKDSDGKTIRTNQAFNTMIGLSKEEIIGKTSDELFLEHGKDMIKDDQEVMELGKPKLDIIEHYDSPEGTRWARTGKAPLKDRKGNVVGLIGYAVDITEQKQAEEALRESEERFRQFFENEPEYCYMISPEGVILNVNKAALKVLGYKKEELVNKPLKTIYAPESLPKTTQLFLKWRKTGKLKDEELVIITKNGNKRIVLLSTGVVKDKDGKILHSVSVQKDITEQKQAEEALKQEKDKLQDALAEVKKLSGLLPICANCKKIRDDKGYWNQIEVYIRDHSEADFSHSICPECEKKLYPEFYKGD